MKIKNMPPRKRWASIAMIGSGGLIGSHAAPHFARMNEVRTIYLVDPDAYEPHNVGAQSIRPADVGRLKVDVGAEVLRTIAPEVNLCTFAERVQSVPLGVLAACDLVVTCLDSKLVRLCVNRIAQRISKPLIDAGVRGDGLLARVSVLPGARDGACLECGWTPSAYIKPGYRQHCVTAEATNSPSYLGALIASYQAMESRKLLTGCCADPMGYQVLLDLTHHTLSHTKLFRTGGCRCDHTAWDIERINPGPDQLTLGEVLELGRSKCGPGPMGLSLYGKQFFSALLGPCGHRWQILKLSHRLSDRDRTCPKCASRAVGDALPGPFDIEERLLESKHQLHLDRSLSEFGFRSRDVITVEGVRGDAHFELGAETHTANGRAADDDRSGTRSVSEAAA